MQRFATPPPPKPVAAPGEPAAETPAPSQVASVEAAEAKRLARSRAASLAADGAHPGRLSAARDAPEPPAVGPTTQPSAELEPPTRPRAEFPAEPPKHAPRPQQDSAVARGCRRSSRTCWSTAALRRTDFGEVTAEAAAFDAGPPPIPEAAYSPAAQRAPVALAPPPPPESPADGDNIRPFRIISVGQSFESERRAAALRDASIAAGVTPTFGDGASARPISRPPMHAAVSLESFTAPRPAPTPDIEEVDVDDEEPDTSPKPPVNLAPVAGSKPGPRTEEIETIEEIEVERTEYESTTDEVTVEMDAPLKKAPSPPPKRSETPAAGIAVVADPKTPQPGAVAEGAKKPPPAPRAAPGDRPAASAPEPPRKRPKAWWDELFGDDFLRTMDRPEPKTIKRECDFVEDRLGVEKGAVVLDLCCGNGAHAVELASRGYNVVGYDLSLAMLAHAADEAQAKSQRINFLQGDMRDMAFEDMFDAVYCWSTSFGYFEDEKNVDVLARIRKALRPGGVLLLDLTNRDYVAARQPSLVWFEGEGCVCMDEMSLDFFTSRLRVKRTVMFEDGRAREIEYSIRLYALNELGKMLHEAGFKVIEITGHPAHPGVFFGSESPRIIVLAERGE